MKVKSKIKSKRVFSITALSVIALFSLSTVFASACKSDEEDSSVDNTNTGYTIDTSGISLTGSTQVVGETKTVSTAEDLYTALQNATAGDTIIIANGTYEYNYPIVLSNSGSYNGYITVKAADNANVVLDFSEMTFDSTNRGVQIDGSYWHWYGIEIMGAGDNGMYIGGNYNIIENCEFHDNRDTGLQLGRSSSDYTYISQWPSYNLIKNCTSYNNYDNETKGENADGFAAKLTVGYGNVFDGCIAYRNSDDGWDLYAYNSNGDIGAVIIYNCVAFENGFLERTVEEFNNSVGTTATSNLEDSSVYTYTTAAGDGNGFKLGGSVMRGNVKLYNSLSFNNRMHGVTDNSNPGVLTIEGVTSYNNGATIDLDPESEYFGQVNGGATGDDQCNNIDVARSETSYNNLKNILSIADQYGNPGSDRYRGSVSNSIFYNTSGYRQFTDYEDAYSQTSGMNGTAMTTAPVSEEIFKALPHYTIENETTDNDGNTVTETVYVYNISGLENPDIHETYRNDDDSINMGDILAIVDPAAVYNTGCTINYTSWDQYTHYYDTVIGEASSSEDAVLMAVYNTLYLYCDPSAVYQDFTLTTSILGATISWSSSNEDILHINKQYNSSNSSSQDVTLNVYRPSEDTVVTLTANINYRGKTAVKRFDITVKADNPSIGNVYVYGLEDAQSESSRRFIIDQWEVFTEPSLIVENAADYNGKTLAEGTYTVETKYEYATSATSTYTTVNDFSASVAGVFRITKTVYMNDDPENTVTYTFYIYVASNSATIDFVEGTSGLTVYRDGYILSGDMTNVKGTLFAYSTSDESEIEALNAMSEEEKLAALQAKEGVEEYSFTDNSISAEFENDNDTAYTVYYWFENGAGTVTSEVHTQSVSVVTISTPQEFLSELSNNNAQTIYLLDSDLDFTGVTYTRISNLYGLLNGDGHTISNVTISGSGDTGLFRYLDGGTIMNIQFKDISITSSSSRAAIIAQSRGGYISKVLLTNVDVYGTERVSALIAQHSTGNLYLTEVVLENDENSSILGTNSYVGGLIGFIQSSSAGVSFGYVYVGDCYVNSHIRSEGTYAGGVVGDFQDRSVDDILILERCYVRGTLQATTYLGGVLASQRNTAGGEYVLTINECIFMGTLIYNGETLSEPLKNCSGIVGRYTETALINITNCFSSISEYYYEEFVQQTSDSALAQYRFWTTNYVKTFDLENVWEFLGDSSTTAESPYVVLRFVSMFQA